jgi:hypothetical protein
MEKFAVSLVLICAATAGDVLGMKKMTKEEIGDKGLC